MLGGGEIPGFGVVDWRVESGVFRVDRKVVADAIGHSSLVSGIPVMPAFGAATLENPADAPAKISRAIIDTVNRTVLSGGRFW